MKVFISIFVQIVAVYCIVKGASETCEYDNIYVGKNNYKDITGITNKEECKKICFDDPTSRCKHSEYNKDLKRCLLSELPVEEAIKQNLIRHSSSFKLLAACPKVTELRQYTDIVIGGAQRMKVIRDIPAAECKAACKAHSGCHHAEYEVALRRCSLGAMTCKEAKEKELIRNKKGYILFSACPIVSSCEFENSVIKTKAYKTIREISREECRLECLTDPSSKCRSINYETAKQMCFLSTITQIEAKERDLFRERNTRYVLISTCPRVNFDNMLEYKNMHISDTPYKQLRSVRKEDCRSACAADPRCKHCEYKEKEQRCLLGEVSCDEAKKTNRVRELTGYLLFAQCPLVKNCKKENSFIVSDHYRRVLDIDEETCKKECLTEPRNKCKVANYNKKNKQCYLKTKDYATAIKNNKIYSSPNYTLFYAC